MEILIAKLMVFKTIADEKLARKLML